MKVALRFPEVWWARHVLERAGISGANWFFLLRLTKTVCPRGHGDQPAAVFSPILSGARQYYCVLDCDCVASWPYEGGFFLTL